MRREAAAQKEKETRKKLVSRCACPISYSARFPLYNFPLVAAAAHPCVCVPVLLDEAKSSLTSCSWRAQHAFILPAGGGAGQHHAACHAGLPSRRRARLPGSPARRRAGASSRWRPGQRLTSPVRASRGAQGCATGTASRLPARGRSMLRWRSRRSGMAALLGKSTPRARGARALYRRSQSSFASYLTPAHSGRPWAFSCPTQSGTVTNVWPTGHNIWPGGHDMHGIPRRCVLLHSRLAETAGIFSEPGGWK